MKLRNGFVSNSSSCSFTIDKWNLSPEQIYMIENYQHFAKEMNMSDYDCEWSLEHTETSIHFYTSMDNFDMLEFLNRIGVNDKDILNIER